MKILSIDIETAKIPNHLPWCDGFYITVCCCIPSWGQDTELVWFDHYEHVPTPNSIGVIQGLVDECDVIAGQNLKYDLNILKWMGVKVDDKKLHCTMVTEYLLQGQSREEHSFDLSTISAKYGLPPKLDLVKEYWDKGVDTYDIPAGVLREYVIDDTAKVHHITPIQIEKIGGLKRVYDIQMEYIHSLSDMELNGFKWDQDRAAQIVDETKELIQQYTDELLEIAGDKRINLNSGDQLSVFLYGGTAKISWQEWVVHELKTKPYSRFYEKTFTEGWEYEGIGFTPLPRTELKKQGYYSTDKSVISELKCKTPVQRRVKTLLLELSTISKILETLFGKTNSSGLMNKVRKDGKIHTNYNQAVTKTGRLSSSDPNGQNLPRGQTSPIKQCIISGEV